MGGSVEAIVALISSTTLVPSVLASLRKYLAARGGKKKVKITINGQELELDNVSEKQAEEIIALWLSRHRGNPMDVDAE